MGAYGSRQFREELELLKNNDPRLYYLSLEQVPLGDDGVRLLASALHGNKVLRRLSLGHCGISPAGLQALASALCDRRSAPPKLKKLELSTSPAPFPLGNPIGDEGAIYIANVRLYMEIVVKCASIRHLSLGSCSIGDRGAGIIAQALAGNTSLRTIDLSYNSISDIGAEKLGAVLAKNQSLRGLSLWHNRVFHSGAEALANGIASNSTLKWLGLGCNHIGDEGVKALALALLSNAHDSRLCWLGLGGNEITDRGAEHLAVALKAQHGGNGQLTTDSEGETSSLTEQIRLGGLRPALELGVTPSHVSLAAGSQDEEGEGPESEDGGEMVRDETGIYGDSVYCIPLESVGLGGNQITCTGVASLADGLKSNTRLVSLGLADNLIGNNGAAALAELVRQSDTLESLVLSGNDIGDEGGGMMIAALTQNTSLKALYMAGNPLGDGVSKRCLEVVGHHNHTLQLLDVHNTRMSTPAVYDLVEGMQEQRILRALGSQPLPLQSDGTDKSCDLPATGNMLEMEDWRPPSYHTILLQKQGKRLTSTAPSQRYTTYEVFGSLPEPEETAQTLVIKDAQSAGRPSHKRKTSISHFFRRKLSRKKESSITSFDIPLEVPRPKISKSPVGGGVELHTLSELDEDEAMAGGPAFEETMISSQFSDEPFMASTLDSSQHIHTRTHDHMTIDMTDIGSSPPHHFTDPPQTFTNPLALSDRLNQPLPFSDDSTDSLLATAVSMSLDQDDVDMPVMGEDISPPTRTHDDDRNKDVDFDSVGTSDQLSSLTKQRVKPPTNRRPPSRQRSSSPSPRRHPTSTTPSLPSGNALVTRVAGITGISSKSGPSDDQSWPDLDAKTIKQQWHTALQKRVGMLKMGSFLHTGFEAIKNYKPHPPPDTSYACLPRNKSKNRGGAPLPPSHSRVKLQLVLEEVGSDYINANYVEIPNHPHSKMIVTQAPLTGTSRDFWRMVWEQRTAVVIAMTTAEEKWWPEGHGGQQRHSLVVGRSWADGCLSVKLVSKEVRGGCYTVYRLCLESIDEQESDTVLLYHFTEWPQHGIPDSGTKAVCQMYHEAMAAKSTQPLVVASELGAGRAGCFCAVALAHELLSESGPSFVDGWSYDVNILDLVIRGLCRCRGNLVENQMQYEFCHHLLVQVLVGRASQGVATKGEKKTSKWKLFQGKSSNKETTAGKSNTAGKQGKTKKKKQSKASKQPVPPLTAAEPEPSEDEWGDVTNLLW